MMLTLTGASHSMHANYFTVITAGNFATTRDAILDPDPYYLKRSHSDIRELKINDAAGSTTRFETKKFVMEDKNYE